MNFFKHHPITSYILLTFLISWGGIFATTGFVDLSMDEFNQLMPAIVTFLISGPILSAIVISWVLDRNLSALIYEFKQWRVELKYWLIALFLVPLAPLITLLVLSLFSSSYLPIIVVTENKFELIAMGIGIGLFGGFMEEFGWTGFVAARTKKRPLFSLAITTGLLWGLWHLPTSFWGRSGTIGSVPLWIYLPVVLLAFTVPLRIILFWLYRQSQSIYPAMVMHASLIPSVFFVFVPQNTGWAHLFYYIVLAVVFWLIAWVLGMKERIHDPGILVADQGA